MLKTVLFYTVQMICYHQTGRNACHILKPTVLAATSLTPSANLQSSATTHFFKLQIFTKNIFLSFSYIFSGSAEITSLNTVKIHETVGNSHPCIKMCCFRRGNGMDQTPLDSGEYNATILSY